VTAIKNFKGAFGLEAKTETAIIHNLMLHIVMYCTCRKKVKKSYFTKDIARLEKVQQRALRIIIVLNNLTYEQCLAK